MSDGLRKPEVTGNRKGLPKLQLSPVVCWYCLGQPEEQRLWAPAVTCMAHDANLCQSPSLIARCRHLFAEIPETFA